MQCFIPLLLQQHYYSFSSPYDDVSMYQWLSNIIILPTLLLLVFKILEFLEIFTV